MENGTNQARAERRERGGKSAPFCPRNLANRFIYPLSITFVSSVMEYQRNERSCFVAGSSVVVKRVIFLNALDANAGHFGDLSAVALFRRWEQ